MEKSKSKHKEVKIKENLIGLKVDCKKYGTGLVTSQGNDIFMIQFDSGEVKKFAYPLAIEKGTIVFI